jgi:hypothetical protein
VGTRSCARPCARDPVFPAHHRSRERCRAGYGSPKIPDGGCRTTESASSPRLLERGCTVDLFLGGRFNRDLRACMRLAAC